MPVSIKQGLRTTDSGYKTRTEVQNADYGPGLKHGLRYKMQSVKSVAPESTVNSPSPLAWADLGGGQGDRPPPPPFFPVFLKSS